MKIGIVGVGNMGGSIAKGLIRNENFLNHNLYLYNRTISKLDKYKSENVNVCNDVVELINNSEVIVLAIKPNQYKEWLEEYKELIQSKLLITIAAGISSEFLSRYTNLFSIAMPNMGSSILKGFTVVCENKLVSSELSLVLIEETIKIFENFGIVKVIDEKELSTYIGLIGSSPAYFMNIIDKMKDTFVNLGYEEKETEQTLAYIMSMSADLILSNQDKSASELVDSVCSPNGTTIEAVKELKKSDISDIFESSITKCIKRANVMTGENDKK